jgi:hypothetical protein
MSARFVVADAEAAELIQPGKGTLDDPAPPAQAAPVRGAAHGQQRHDVTPEAAPNAGRVVAAIPDHRVRPLPRSHACALQRGNRIHQRQGFLRVVPVRAGLDERQEARPARRKSNDACSRASLGRWDWVRSDCHHAPRARSSYRRRPATNRSGRSERANPAMQSGSDPTRLPVASRATAANRSCPNRSRVPAAASATECHCGERRLCRLDMHDRRRAVVPPLVVVVNLAGTVRQDPTRHREAARRPYPAHDKRGNRLRLLSGARSGGFVMRS